MENYELFYDFVEKIYPQLSVVLSNMPVLSDMGKGIKKFCTKRNLKQFFCIRHLINAIGASSLLGKISSKLLMESSIGMHKMSVKKSRIILPFHE